MASSPRISTDSSPGLPASADLSRVSAIRLYYLAARAERTGSLGFKLADRTIVLHLRKGNPEVIVSTHPDDSMSRFLVRHKLLTSEQLAQVQTASNQAGGDVLGALFALHLLSPNTTIEAVAQHAALLLSRAFASPTGTFTYQSQQLANRATVPLGNRWGLMVDSLRRNSSAELKRRLHAQLDQPMTKARIRESTSEFQLSPQEARAISHLDESRTLNQLMRAFPQEAETLIRMAFLLREVGALTFAYVAIAEKPAGRAGVKGELTKAKVNAWQSPPKAAAAELDIDELRYRVQQVKSQTLFQLLGVSEKSDTAAIKAAYFRWAKVFHPDTVPQDAPPEVSKLKSELFAALGNAYRRLADENSRAAYLDELKGGAQEVNVTQIFVAEELFNRGCLLVKSRRFADAVKILDEAIKANPDEGEFYAWRGYAKFFVLKEKPGGTAEAQQELQLALSKNERCASAHFFLGQISKLLGEKAAALKHFKRALELKPDHVDAQREVRVLTSKH